MTSEKYLIAARHKGIFVLWLKTRIRFMRKLDRELMVRAQTIDRRRLLVCFMKMKRKTKSTRNPMKEERENLIRGKHMRAESMMGRK